MSQPEVGEDTVMAVKSIRWALVIGLQALCELDRLCGASVSSDLPKHLRPIHPTGSDQTVLQFADALRWVESIAEGEL